MTTSLSLLFSQAPKSPHKVYEPLCPSLSSPPPPRSAVRTPVINIPKPIVSGLHLNMCVLQGYFSSKIYRMGRTSVRNIWEGIIVVAGWAWDGRGWCSHSRTLHCSTCKKRISGQDLQEVSLLYFETLMLHLSIVIIWSIHIVGIHRRISCIKWILWKQRIATSKFIESSTSLSLIDHESLKYVRKIAT